MRRPNLPSGFSDPDLRTELWLTVAILVMSLYFLASVAIGETTRTGWPAPSAAGRAALESDCENASEPAVVRVVHSVAGSTSYGSGTVIVENGRTVVLTCGHLFRDGQGETSVVLADGRTVRASVLSVDSEADLAALSIGETGASAVRISDRHPVQGEDLKSCGYGRAGDFRCNTGQALGYVSTTRTRFHETLKLTGFVRQGDSGGPVLNRRGELVAVIWGTNGEAVYGTYCGRIREFLSRLPRLEAFGERIPRAPNVVPPGANVASPDSIKISDESLERLEAILRDIKTEQKLGDTGNVAPVEKFGRGDAIDNSASNKNVKSAGRQAGQSTDNRNVSSIVSAAAAAATSGVFDGLLPAGLATAATALGLAVPPAGVLIAAGFGARWLVRRRRRRKSERPDDEVTVDAVGSFPRDSTEAAQILRLSQLEGRSPLHDAIIGRIAFDEIQNAIDTKPDGPQAAFARSLRATLEDRFNSMAPLAVDPQPQSA